MGNLYCHLDCFPNLYFSNAPHNWPYSCYSSSSSSLLYKMFDQIGGGSAGGERAIVGEVKKEVLFIGPC